MTHEQLPRITNAPDTDSSDILRWITSHNNSERLQPGRQKQPTRNRIQTTANEDIQMKFTKELLTEQEQAAFKSYDFKRRKGRHDEITEEERDASRKYYRCIRDSSPERTLKTLYSRHKSCAKTRNIGWELTYEEFVALVLDTTVCPILGIPLVYKCFKGKGQNTKDPAAASLDRIDSSLPYTLDNVRIVSWAYNSMKNSWSDEQLYAYAKAIVSYHEKQ